MRKAKPEAFLKVLNAQQNSSAFDLELRFMRLASRSNMTHHAPAGKFENVPGRVQRFRPKRMLCSDYVKYESFIVYTSISLLFEGGFVLFIMAP